MVFFHNIFGRGAILVGFDVSNRCGLFVHSRAFNMVFSLSRL